MNKRLTLAVAGGVILSGLGLLGASALVKADSNNHTQVFTQTTPSPPRVAPAEPRTLQAAQDAAQRGWDRFTSGDLGGAYDTLEPAFRNSISRADYITVFTACNENLETPTGMAVTVTDPRWKDESRTRVTVTLKFLIATANRDMVYDDGRWYQIATADAKATVATWKKSGLKATLKKHCTPSYALASVRDESVTVTSKTKSQPSPTARRPVPAAATPKVTTLRPVTAIGSQATIDQGKLVTWMTSPTCLIAGHDTRGWAWLDNVPTGRPVVVATGPCADTYKVVGHRWQSVKGGPVPSWMANYDLILQTCTGRSGMGFSLLQRV